MMRVRRLDLYILNEFFFSFLVAFSFFFFIFFVNQLLVMAEEIFSRHVAFGDVLLFILFSLPSIVALAFPFGSLVGGLMAAGVPVIAMDMGSCREVILDGQTGYLVNSVSEAIDAVGKIEKIDRKMCRKHVEENFTIDSSRNIYS